MGKLTDEQKIEVVQKYLTGKYSCNKLSKEYGITQSSLSGLLKRRKINIKNNLSEINRKYKINESYFDIINTEDKAYFLGFLYADGYNNNKKKLIRINLQESDKNILEKFKDKIKSEHLIKFVKSKNIKWKNQYLFYFNSKKISNRLTELGCYQKKSLTLKFPTKEQVPEHLIRHFIRGYYDGDGSIWFVKNSNRIKCNLCIVSSKEFCEKLQEHMKGKIRTKKNWTNTRMITLTKSKMCIFFLNWMYKNAEVYLDRKYDMYLEYKKRIRLFKKRLRKNGIDYLTTPKK